MTRSQGPSNLVEFQQDLGKFERAKKRERLQRLREAEMANVRRDDNLPFVEDIPPGGNQGQFQEHLPPANNNPRGPAIGGNVNVAAGENAAAGGGVNAAAGQQRPVPIRRTLRDHDAPNAYMYRGGIQPPPIHRQDFEIKPGLLALVKQNQFHGLSSENPVYHLENFEEICGTTRMNGVPDDAVKCRLFSFSLSDKAHRWLKSLEPGSIRSWDEYKAAFLGQYFTQARTTHLRNKISSFQQAGTESFYEAWERFKEYYRECPHHGFTHASLLNTFYRGVDERYRMALDTASNGDFTTKTEEEAQTLIENLAASNSNHCADYDRSLKASSSESRRIAELTAKVDQLMKRDVRMVNYCEDQGEAQEYAPDCFEDQQAELNYVNGQGNFQNRGFNQNYRNHPNLSYRSTNVENPQDQVYPAQGGLQGQQFQPKQFAQGQSNFNKGFQNKGSAQNSGFGQNSFQPKTQFNNYQGNYQAPYQAPAVPTQAPSSQDNELKMMMQQLLEGQKKSANDINVKVDSMYNDLNGKFESLSTHFRALENHVAHTALSSKRPMGTLPGKPD